VAELISIIDFNGLTTTSGNTFNHLGSYWTRDVCATDSYWVVDMATALTTCVDIVTPATAPEYLSHAVYY
jgi:hypothetical protein